MRSCSGGTGRSYCPGAARAPLHAPRLPRLRIGRALSKTLGREKYGFPDGDGKKIGFRNHTLRHWVSRLVNLRRSSPVLEQGILGCRFLSSQMPLRPHHSCGVSRIREAQMHGWYSVPPLRHWGAPHLTLRPHGFAETRLLGSGYIGKTTIYNRHRYHRVVGRACSVTVLIQTAGSCHSV